MSKHAISKWLSKKKFPAADDESGERIEELQMKLLRIQQGIWHQQGRVAIVFEGFDAAGKGGAIRLLTERLDPRGIRVHPIGPPEGDEKKRHYLSRFWSRLPEPGTIAVFDRSWYGRVLVERVDRLTPPERWKQAYDEINDFERTLVDDGIEIIKFFLVIHPDEQLKRFEERLRDPAKQWKLGDPDLKAHAEWNDYVKAADEMIHRTDSKSAPWIVVPSDSKDYAREQVLRAIDGRLGRHRTWADENLLKRETRDLGRQLAALKRATKKISR